MLSRKFTLIAQILCISLLSCANNKALELGEEPGDYKFPVTKDKWAYTVFGYYVSRSTKFGDVIEYETLNDMRGTRDKLLREYDVTENFKATYPSFIRHKGSTDCGRNTSTIEQMDANMKVLHSSVENKPNEISKALCTLKDMSTD